MGLDTICVGVLVPVTMIGLVVLLTTEGFLRFS